MYVGESSRIARVVFLVGCILLMTAFLGSSLVVLVVVVVVVVVVLVLLLLLFLFLLLRCSCCCG